MNNFFNVSDVACVRDLTVFENKSAFAVKHFKKKKEKVNVELLHFETTNQLDCHTIVKNTDNCSPVVQRANTFVHFPLRVMFDMLSTATTLTIELYFAENRRHFGATAGIRRNR